MENLTARLAALEQNTCSVGGFTIDNVSPEEQEHFLRLLPQARNLEVLSLTVLPPLSEIVNEQARQISAQYRAEKKIAANEERVAYFYTHILSRMLAILPQLPALRQLYLFNVRLTAEQRRQAAPFLQQI